MEVFDIFLSHNSADKPAVEEIGQTQSRWAGRGSTSGPCSRNRSMGLADGLRACATCGCSSVQQGSAIGLARTVVAQNRAAKEANFRFIPILLPGLLEPFDFS